MAACAVGPDDGVAACAWRVLPAVAGVPERVSWKASNSVFTTALEELAAYLAGDGPGRSVACWGFRGLRWAALSSGVVSGRLDAGVDDLPSGWHH